MRTIIEVSEAVVRNLDKLGRQQKKSRAALIREAIQQYLDQQELPHSEAAFGVWKGRGKEGVHYQERLRSEWE